MRFVRLLAPCALMALAANVFSFSEVSSSYNGDVKESTGPGMVGSVDCGGRVLANGASDGAGIAYFPVSTAEHGFQVVAIQAGTGSAGPQVTDRRTVGTDLTGAQLAWGGGELLVVTPSAVLAMAATTTLGEPTSRALVRTANPLGVVWDAARGQLLVETALAVDCYDRSTGSFALRGSLSVASDGMAYDPGTATIYLTTATQLQTYRWLAGAAAPEAGGVLDIGAHRPGLALSAGAATRLVVFREQSCSTFSAPPFPQAPIPEGTVETRVPPSTPVVGQVGLYFGSLDYLALADSAQEHSDDPAVVLGGARRGVFVNATEALLAPAPDVAGKFRVEQYSSAVPNTPDYVQFITYRSEPGWLTTSMEFNALKAVGAVTVAVYTADTVPTSGGPGSAFRLQWQSEPIPVANVGWNKVVLGGAGFETPTSGTIAIACRATNPGVLGERAAGAYGDFQYGFRLPAGAALPNAFDWADRLPRTSGMALRVTAETKVALGDIHAYMSWIFDDPADGIVSNKQPMSLVLPTRDLLYLEIDENEAFERPWRFVDPVPSGDPNRRFALWYSPYTPVPDGPLTLYARARGNNQAPVVKPLHLTFDSTPPGAPGTPAVPVTLNGTILPLTWTPAEDNPGGVGIWGYQIDAGTGPRVYTRSTSYDLPVRVGTTVVIRIAAIDRAGNFGSSSQPTARIPVLPAEDPALTVEPRFVTTNNPVVSYRAYGLSSLPATLQSSVDDSAFAQPQVLPWVAPVTEASMDFAALPDGSHTVYHLLQTESAVSSTVATVVNLDRVPPVAEPPVPETNYALNGVVKVAWRIPVDPEPSGGGSGYTKIVIFRQGDPTEKDIETDNICVCPSGMENVRTLELREGDPGGVLHAKVWGWDAAGNRSSVAVSEPFVVNARPERPDVTFKVYPPSSGQYIECPASSADPDASDTIVSYRQYFVRTVPASPPVRVEGSLLRPDQTARGETWQMHAWATDNHGAESQESVREFTIEPSRPSMPVVRIHPRSPVEGEPLTVTMEVPSTDFDGGELTYRYSWYRRPAGTTRWQEVVEARDSTTVPGDMLHEGDLWEVICVPHKVIPAVDGRTGYDIVRVGSDDTPPIVTVVRPISRPGAGGLTHVDVRWHVEDNEGGPVLVDVYYTDLGAPGGSTHGLEQVARGVRAENGRFSFDLAFPPGGPYRIHLIATDSQGAATQVTTDTIKEVTMTAEGWALE